jgi:hypothetical protein
MSTKGKARVLFERTNKAQMANSLYNLMFDRVHVDKKWFFLTRVRER